MAGELLNQFGRVINGSLFVDRPVDRRELLFGVYDHNHKSESTLEVSGRLIERVFPHSYLWAPLDPSMVGKDNLDAYADLILVGTNFKDLPGISGAGNMMGQALIDFIEAYTTLDIDAIRRELRFTPMEANSIRKVISGLAGRNYHEVSTRAKAKTELGRYLARYGMVPSTIMDLDLEVGMGESLAQAA